MIATDILCTSHWLFQRTVTLLLFTAFQMCIFKPLNNDNSSLYIFTESENASVCLFVVHWRCSVNCTGVNWLTVKLMWNLCRWWSTESTAGWRQGPSIHRQPGLRPAVSYHWHCWQLCWYSQVVLHRSLGSWVMFLDIIYKTFKKLHAHTHTCLMALCPGLSGWADTRKVKPIDFTEARDSEWQWHQLACVENVHVAPDG